MWVAHSATDGTVSRLDPESDTVAATVSTSTEPRGVAVGAGAVWVAGVTDGSLLRIDPATDDVGGNLDSLGLGNIDPGNAAEFAQSVCPMLAEPGQQVADAAAQASDDLGRPLPGTMFAGAAISMFCPAAINSMANGQSPLPLPMLSGLGNLGGFGN